MAIERKILTPALPLTPDVRIWLSEILNFYNQNIYPVEFQIYRKCVKKLSSPDFGPDKIDERLLSYRDELNIYGIYCLDPTNKYIDCVDKIIRHIKTLLVNPQNDNERCIMSSEELSKVLHVPNKMISVCITLISHIPAYFHNVNCNRKAGEFGLSPIAINDVPTAQVYLNYNSIDRILEYFFNYLGQKNIPKQEIVPLPIKSVPRLVYSRKSFSLETIGRELFGFPHKDYKTIKSHTQKEIAKYPERLLKKDSYYQRMERYFLEQSVVKTIILDRNLPSDKSDDILDLFFPQ
jgi:hypothetical protein